MTRFVSKKFAGLKFGDKVSVQQGGSCRAHTFVIAELDVQEDTAERFIGDATGAKFFEGDNFTVELLQRGDRIFG